MVHLLTLLQTRSGLSVRERKLSETSSDGSEISSEGTPLQELVSQDVAFDTQLDLSAKEQVSDEAEQPEGDFILFPELPPELRNKIWKLSMPGPRIVRIKHDPRDMYAVELNEIDLAAGRNPWWRAKAIAGPVPALLHVNREARSFVRQHYKLFFHNQTQGRPIYFNAALDTLFLGGADLNRAFYGRKMESYMTIPEDEMKHMYDTENQVRLLALSSGLLWSYEAHVRVLSRFTKLDEVIVLEAPSSYRDSHRVVKQDIEQRWAQAGSKIPQFKYLSSEKLGPKYFWGAN